MLEKIIDNVAILMMTACEIIIGFMVACSFIVVTSICYILTGKYVGNEFFTVFTSFSKVIDESVDIHYCNVVTTLKQYIMKK